MKYDVLKDFLQTHTNYNWKDFIVMVEGEVVDAIEITKTHVGLANVVLKSMHVDQLKRRIRALEDQVFNLKYRKKGKK